jgi:leucyl/phenylalanyl-tRNA---protein transferase
MMKMVWLSPNDTWFPHPETASSDGLVAVGGDLSPTRLLTAYSMGIFPWFVEDEVVYWFSPNPRLVLFPDELKIAKSMRPYFSQAKFKVTYNQAFTDIMIQCAEVMRNGQDGTWISGDMIEAYTRLHYQGFAHSVEVWDNDEHLVGGLYGIALGHVFFGESMFSKVSNASRFGFISLVQMLKNKGFRMIDCQQETRYLMSFGARSIPRSDFCRILKDNEQYGLSRLMIP